MAETWNYYRQGPAQGVIWMDPDVIIDPYDLNGMREDAGGWPDQVSIGMHMLWPASTMRDDWVWSFGPVKDGTPIMSQDPDQEIGWFAMGFTYTPRRLLDLALPEMPFWEFGQVDMGLSRIARANHIQVALAGGCNPKHMHFYSREGDASWHGPAGT